MLTQPVFPGGSRTAPSVLAIDFGERRIGLALASGETGLALPIGVIQRRSDAQAIAEIAARAAREQVGQLVVGEPRRPDGERGPAAERARRFAAKLAEATGLPCALAEETLTTVEATERLRAAGVPERAIAARVDAVAAQVLLEQYLADRSAR